MLDKKTDKEEWCIVRFRNTAEDRERDYDILVRKRYQWEEVGEHFQHRGECVARGFKSNEEALQWVKLFKE